MRTIEIVTTLFALSISVIGAGCAIGAGSTESLDAEDTSTVESAVNLSNNETAPAAGADISYPGSGLDGNAMLSAQPAGFCGGIAGIPCARGLYCLYAPEAMCGAADAGGTCAVQPKLCTREYVPVCGCDGETYGNACGAAASGVSVAHDGECSSPIAGVGESCGGFRVGPPPMCAEGLYCSFAIGDICGFADAPGLCAKKATECTEEVDPVCGCDGKTYPNACFASMAGASVFEAGPCSPTPPG